MQKNRILLIATYDRLYTIADGLVKQHRMPVAVVRGNSENAAEILARWRQKGVEVVVSRGGTYRELKDDSSVSVLEIKVSLFDILRAGRGILDQQMAVGFIGYGNVVYGASFFRELYGKELHIINVRRENDLQSIRGAIENAVKHGVRVFIGDRIGVKIVTDLGYSGRLIETTEESVLASLQEAVAVLAARRQERARAERVRVIVDHMREGVVAVDEQGRFVIFNETARAICTGNNMTEEDFGRAILHESTPREHSTEIRKIGPENLFLCNRSPIVIDGNYYGTVITIRDADQVQDDEAEIRRKLSAKGLAAKYSFPHILYRGEAMNRAVEAAEKYAAARAPVLIQGPSGSGKELFAHSIHNAGARAAKPFIAVNCAALPENLLESELFGYAGGAFTGARKGGKPGLFELAHKGTIFLDEIGDMPKSLQSRLLRVLQEKEVMRIGDDKIIPVDVRIIAATHQNIKQLAQEGRFRDDLYYRLHILTLRIPPLAERPEDILPLAEFFLKQYAAETGKMLRGFAPGARRSLLAHGYPGNVRELRGIVERAAVIGPGPYINEADLDIDASPRQGRPLLKTAERELMERTLRETNGSYAKAAKILGINRATLYRKVPQNK